MINTTFILSVFYRYYSTILKKYSMAWENNSVHKAEKIHSKTKLYTEYATICR